MESIRAMAKAIIAALVAGLGSVATALATVEDGDLANLDDAAWIAAAIVTLSAFAATYVVPNREKIPAGIEVEVETQPADEIYIEDELPFDDGDPLEELDEEVVEEEAPR